MKKRYIGPANPGPGGQDLGHEVVVAGRLLGTVRPGGVIEVPDDLAASKPPPAWSPALWEDVAEAAPSRKKNGSEG